jgi:hypothetical protein
MTAISLHRSSHAMKQTKCKIHTAPDEIKHDKPLTLTSEQLQLILSAQTQEPAQADTEDLPSEQDNKTAL